MYMSTGCAVFGRDEGDAEGTLDFSFTKQRVDAVVEKWSQIVRAEGINATATPNASAIMAVELCISDRNKALLLSNPAFIPYLVDALLLVRAELDLSQCTRACSDPLTWSPGQ